MDINLDSLANAATLKLITEIVTGLYSHLSQRATAKIKEHNFEHKSRVLHERISKIGEVKTIWQVDKSVPLSNFYCDSYIVIEGERKKISRFKDFGFNESILIEGIAGQGKSIFLRYLCLNELKHADYIPIFVELRRIQEPETLLNRIFSSFTALGLEIDEEIFSKFAASGKIILLFDAFDEIPEDLKLSVINHIEDLLSKYVSLRIIITSRPNQSIKSSYSFRVAKLDNLKDDERAVLIKKLCEEEEELAYMLLAHIDSKVKHMKNLFCTPLLVTLLVVSYKAYKTLPDNIHEYYENLFIYLLQRHEGTKPGFKRETKSKLDDFQYRIVFETLCFMVKKSREKVLTYETMYIFVESSLKDCGIKVSPGLFLDDIVNMTCLILKEGDEYCFIHKTVQEYYAASFIRRKPEKPWAQKFYKTMVKDRTVYTKWQQELAFLSEIDDYKYKKYFKLPIILNFLNISENNFKHDITPKLNTILKDNLNKILIVKIDGSSETYFYSCRLNDNVGDDFVKSLACLISTNRDITKKLFSDIHNSNADIEHKLLESTRLVTIAPSQSDLNICTHRVTSRSISLSHNDLRNKKFQSIISGAQILSLCNDSVKNELYEFCSTILNDGKLIRKTLSDKENVSLLEDLN